MSVLQVVAAFTEDMPITKGLKYVVYACTVWGDSQKRWAPDDPKKVERPVIIVDEGVVAGTTELNLLFNNIPQEQLAKTIKLSPTPAAWARPHSNPNLVNYVRRPTDWATEWSWTINDSHLEDIIVKSVMGIADTDVIRRINRSVRFHRHQALYFDENAKRRLGFS